LSIRSSNRQVAQMDANPRMTIHQSRRALEIRATFTMMLSTLGFSLCWLPVSVIDFIDVFTGGGNLPRQVFMLNAFLIFTSSSINPFIYWLSNRDFRKAFREMFRFARENVVIDSKAISLSTRETKTVQDSIASENRVQSNLINVV